MGNSCNQNGNLMFWCILPESDKKIIKTFSQKFDKLCVTKQINENNSPSIILMRIVM